jgi:hypothetical protein
MGNRSNSVRPQQLTLNPGLVRAAPTNRITIRFSSSNSQAISITRACLLSLCCAYNGVSPCPTLWSSVRIKRVRYWVATTSSTVGQPTIVNMVWTSDVGPISPISRVTMGVGPAVCMSSTPPRASRAAMWCTSAATATTKGETLFELSTDQDSITNNGAVFELDLEYSIADLLASTVSFTGGTPAGSSGIFYNALDSLTSSNSIGTWAWYPIGVARLFSAAPTTFTRTN